MHLLHGSISKLAIVQLQHLPKYGVNATKHTVQSRKRNMAYITAGRSINSGIYETLSRFFANQAEASKRRGVYNQTVRELNELSGRDLADLGIHRTEIKRIAYEAAYRN